ncbi:MAG: GWxTD domain-containing protein [Candidatus Aminicenantes bacterium]|nr:GWxTD domain-containing protein [Candidatus Aminicenantes bacterium]
MKRKFCKGIFPVILLGMVITLNSTQNAELPQKYKKWVEEEIIYIITPKEKEIFFKLENDRERDLFIEEFWRQRDPTPGTPRNEFKDEHYRRIEYANKKFGRETPIKGWRTDRGRIYIMLGRPPYVERHSTGDIHPIEIWYYHGNPKLGQAPSFRLLFFQRYRAGEFKLYSPIADGPKSLVPFTERTHAFYKPKVSGAVEKELLEKLNKANLDNRDVDAYMILHYNVGPDLAEASFSNFPGRSGPEYRLPSSILIGDVETYPHKKVDDDYAYEFLEHKAIVEVSYSVYYIGNHSKVSILQDPSGFFFVNYILVPEILSVDFYEDKYFTNLKASFRLTDAEGKTIYQGERNVPLELRENELKILEKSSFHLCDSFPVISGNYTFNLLMENMVTKEFTSFEKDISVPGGEYLQMSPLILARKVNKDSPYSQSNRAYQVGNLQIYPSVNNTFLQKDTLFLFFQIYGLNQKLKEEGLLEFTFYSDGQIFQTKRRNLDEYKNGRDFLEEISLEKFPSGIYTLEVALLDWEGRKHLSEREAFSVATKPFPGSWVLAQTNPPADDPYYSYILGNQFLNKGEVQKAHDELAKAYETKQDSLDYALSFTRVLSILKDFQKVRQILIPFAEAGKENFGLFYTLGQASKEMGKFEEAIDFFQKGLSHKGNVVEVLNSLGECHFKLGHNEQALRAWEKSLEINPNQEKIKKFVERLNYLRLMC